MQQLRVVAPTTLADRVRTVLLDASSATCFIALGPVAQNPHGEVFLCDLAPETADAVISQLQELGLPRVGSIAVQEIGLEISRRAAGEPSGVRGTHDIAWESVEAATSESTEMSQGFLAFMALAVLIAASGIVLDTAILIVGAMIVGPDFGPIAGTCVAVVERRASLAIRSLEAIVVGFTAAIAVDWGVMALFRAGHVIGPTLTEAPGRLSPAVAQVVGGPGFFTFFVAFCAGIAGMLSLSTAKSGALIGVLVSVTTIPAAANVGLAMAYGRWGTALASLDQLAVNIGTILAAGTATLLARRFSPWRRRAAGRPGDRSAAPPR